MKVTTLVVVVLMVASALAEASHTTPRLKPKPKKVRCKEKYSRCHNKHFTCPASCPLTCSADCNTCQAVCKPVLPSPKFQKPKKVKCKDKRFSACYNKPLFCPASCPRTCTVDCSTCKPVCSAPYPPPPSTPTPAPPQPTSPVGSKQVRCINKNYPSCYYRQFTCPAACPQNCQVDCVTCSPVCDCNKPGAVCQDPRFIGADGITFYFHGKKDQDFCIVTDHNLHINAHFIGKRDTTMGRDFTWVQSLGILFNHHKLYIGAQNTTTWNDALDRLLLSFDNNFIYLPETEGATWRSAPLVGVTITRTRSTNAVDIEAEGKFKIKAVVVPITETDSLIHRYGITPQEDSFAHLDLSFKFYSLSDNVNGVLGQTYGSNYVSRVKMGVSNPVLGGERKFHSSSLFGTDCGVSRFDGRFEGVNQGIMEFADLNCASGSNGRGVVCRKR